MLTPREWQQLGTALASLAGASAIHVSGAPVVKLGPALDVLRTFCEVGCFAEALPTGGLRFGWRSPEAAAPVAPVPETTPEAPKAEE